MTILNLHIKEEDKSKLQDLVEHNKFKSMSEIVRKLLSEKIKIENLSKKIDINSGVEIPDYIPKNKYVGFVDGAIISVGDTVNEVAQVAAEKFPNGPLVIKYNGPKKKPLEYCFMSLTDLQCWKYINIEDITYPIIPITIEINSKKKKLYALIDTAASLCVLKQDLIDPTEFSVARGEKVSTAAGIITKNVYEGKFTLLENDFKTEFILAQIDDSLPFNMLIGRNLLDKLDAYFLGKKQLVCIKFAEE